MKYSSTEFRIKEIDWYRYVQGVKKSSDFQKIQEFYVPIGIETKQFKSVGWGSDKESKTLGSMLEEKSRKFILLGEPGAGKTWILRHMFLREATESASSASMLSTIPLYTELADWNIPSNRREPS